MGPTSDRKTAWQETGRTVAQLIWARPLIRSGQRLLVCVLLASAPAGPASGQPPRKYTNVERLSLVRLAAVHDDVQKWKRQRTDIPPLPGFNDYRCTLHAHAEDSAHTGG